LQQGVAKLDNVALIALGVIVVVMTLALWCRRGDAASTTRGGAISGHSAMAFFLGMMILCYAGSRPAGFFGLLLALLVGEVQLEAKTRTRLQVACGSALGAAVGVLVARVFFPMPR
jgi:diacylglycerol kinase (ATP)